MGPQAAIRAVLTRFALNLLLSKVEILLSLSLNDFYKSMTTYADHREWQDVYRPNTSAGRVYLKLTIRNGVLVLSFKEL